MTTFHDDQAKDFHRIGTSSSLVCSVYPRCRVISRTSKLCYVNLHPFVKFFGHKDGPRAACYMYVVMAQLPNFFGYEAFEVLSTATQSIDMGKNNILWINDFGHHLQSSLG